MRAYSVKTEGQRFLTAHFRVREFACRDGSDLVWIDERLPYLLEAIRAAAGRPVTITSAYRTERHNRAVGGVPGSRHLYGMAADIRVPGLSPEKLGKLAEAILGDSGGVGVYPTFVHVDLREKKSRWRK